MPTTPKQAFGGDDDSGKAPPPEQSKKLDLRKYINKPDVNIRDLFWTIMEAYKKKQDVKEQLREFYGQRMSLLRIAVTVATDTRKMDYSMSQNSVATYMIRVILDEKWEDVLLELLESTYDRKKGIPTSFLVGINKAYEDPGYRVILVEYLKKNVRDCIDLESTLAYVAHMQNKELIIELKKELLIIATQDIDENQHYAISALSLIAEDEDVKKALIRLIGDWDEHTRKLVVEVFKNTDDKNVVEEAKKQLPHETNDYIKELMKKMIKKNEVPDGNSKNSSL